MAEPQVLSTLRRKQAEVEATIAAYQVKIDAAKADLAVLGRTLALFDPKSAAGNISAYFELGRLWKAGELAAIV